MTPRTKVGFITIGQSPRDDVLNDLPEMLRDIEAVQVGALDNLTASQIAALQPTDNETVYVSRLRDGSEVSIAKERLIPILEEKVEFLNKDVEVILMLCSGNIMLRNSDKVIFPSKLLRQTVESIAKGKRKRIGIMIPDESQSQLAKNEWVGFAEEVKVVSFSPYTDPIEHLRASSRKLDDRDLIVMDCIGYSRHHTKIAGDVAGKPVVAARCVAFQFLEKFIASLPRQEIEHTAD
ncbi:MAG: AroM family protein [Candidatus Bathyarchaeia archaeon]|jgi:protein AroM